MILISQGEECDTLLAEKEIQLAASESNEKDCKSRLDTSQLAGKLKDRMITGQVKTIAKLERSGKAWKNFGFGLIAYALIREGFTYLREKL